MSTKHDLIRNTQNGYSSTVGLISSSLSPRSYYANTAHPLQSNSATQVRAVKFLSLFCRMSPVQAPFRYTHDHSVAPTASRSRRHSRANKVRSSTPTLPYFLTCIATRSTYASNSLGTPAALPAAPPRSAAGADRSAPNTPPHAASVKYCPHRRT